jgi:hypothetical protein
MCVAPKHGLNHTHESRHRSKLCDEHLQGKGIACACWSVPVATGCVITHLTETRSRAVLVVLVGGVA